MKQAPPIDAVVAWVDGQNLPELAEWLEKYNKDLIPSDVGPCRWRDNGELRYLLRSLERNAPWIRTIHLVTNGQIPDWLDAEAGGIHLVSHNEIFPDPSVLPTFNSLAIDTVLHRIPNIAENYLVFNDDIVLGRPISAADFLTEDGGTAIHVSSTPMPWSSDLGYVYDRELARNQLLMRPIIVPLLSHGPKLFQRSRVEKLWERWGSFFERTLEHRFRSDEDAMINVLYFGTLLAEGPPHREVEGDEIMSLVRVGPSFDLASDIALLSESPRLAICFNDEVDDVERDGWMLDTMMSYLARTFPDPSRFER